MTRSRIDQDKQQLGNPFLGSTITNNLTTNKAHHLFLEDNDNFDLKYIYKTTNVRPPIDEKDVVNKSIVRITYYPLLIK